MANWARGVNFKNSANNKVTGGVGAYGTDGVTDKLYFGLGTEPWNNAGLQLTSSAINFKGNKIYHAGDKPTLADIGAAASSHSHSTITNKGTNTITSTANDTTANWGAQGNSVHWYTNSGQLNNQPSQYGYILNIGHNSEVHQLWMTQSSGNLAHRGGNGSGWNGTWRTILDSSNFSGYAAAASHTHSYLPLSGGSVTGTISSNVATQTHIAGNRGTALINSTAAGNGYNMLAKMNSTNGVWTLGSWTTNFDLFYTANSVVTAGTNNFTKRLTLLNESGNSSFPGTVNAVGGFQWNGQSLDSRYSPSGHSHASLTQQTGVLQFAASAAPTSTSTPTQLGYGCLSSYGILKILGNTDDSSGANNEYVHIAAARGLSPSTSQGLVVYGTYATLNGQNIVVNNDSRLTNSRPANGGNADTVDGLHAAKFYQRHSAHVSNTTNWNDLTVPGCYKIQMASWGATSLNGPNNLIAGLYSFGLLIVDRADDDDENRTVQTYYPHQTSNAHPIVTRMLNGTGWNAWTKIGRGLTIGDIGAAAANHTHSYLSLSGGTMTGRISTPNGSMGIRFGDDCDMGDVNVANAIGVRGAQDATMGGFVFGSSNDTNLYRASANLLKTDDTFNAVGGFQWNGQSLDSRYSPSGHSHSYLSLSGGSLTGDVETRKRLHFMGDTGTTWLRNSSIGSDDNGGVSIITDRGMQFTMDYGGNLTVPNYLFTNNYMQIKNTSASTHDVSYIQMVRANGAHGARFTSSDNGLGLRMHLYNSSGNWATHFFFHPDGWASFPLLSVRNNRLEVGKEGDNSAYVAFYDTTKTRKGYVGKGGTTTNTIHLYSEGGDILLHANSNYAYVKGHWMPDADNTYYLGLTSPVSRRWKQLIAITTAISTSDSRNKENITPIVDDITAFNISREVKDFNIKMPKQGQATKQDYYEFMKDRFYPYLYNYKITSSEQDNSLSQEDKFKCAKSIGFVADEYDLDNDKVAKEFIFKTEDGMLNYNTGSYTTVVAIALQKAIEKIEVLESCNKELTDRLLAIEEKLGL